jgi:hypothetical protein
MSITTIYQLIKHCRFGSSWQGTQFLFYHNLPICLTCPLQSVPIPQNKDNTEIRFHTVEDIIMNKTDELKSGSTNVCQAVLPKVEKMMGFLHCYTWGLF